LARTEVSNDRVTISTVEGVTTSIVQPVGLSNHTPSLKVLWDRARIGLQGDAVVRTLLDGEPRVALFAARGETAAQTGVSVTPYMLQAGEEAIIADRLYAVLSTGHREDAAAAPRAPSADLSGDWDVHIQYAASTSRHTLHLRQRGGDIDGSHQGDFVTRDLTGTIDGGDVRFHSTYDESHGDALGFTFSGTVTPEGMAGNLDMSEYLSATWTATRHQRPVGRSD